MYENNLNILMQCSNFYAPFCGGGGLTSLFENNKDIDNLNVYILTSDMQEDNRQRFVCLAEKYNRIIKFIDASEIDVFCEENAVPKWRNSYAAYYKLFALKFINEKMDRLIYLDSDIVVTGSLKYLLNVDLQNNVLGMVIDNPSESYKNLLGLKKTFYYNSGMIVFNVSKWFSEQCIDQIIHYITHVHSNYPLVDQDILNIIFVNKIKTLPLKYNFFVEILLYHNWDFYKKIFDVEYFYSAEEFTLTKKEAVVWHFNSIITLPPWVRNTDNPARDLWNHYIEQSPWNDFVPIEQKKSFLVKIQMLFYKYLPHSMYAFIYRNVSALLQKRRAKKFGLI